MKFKGFSAIDMLLGLLVLTAVFMLGMSTFKYSVKSPYNNEVKVKTIQEHVDEQVSEIEEARRQAEEFQKELLQEND